MQYPLLQFRRHSQISVALLALAIVSLALFASPARAQTYTLMYNFPGGSKGLQPGSFVVTPSGSIVGEASYNSCSCALLYNYSDGKETVLHRFSEPQGYQEEVPQGLLLSSNGDTLYGTTMYGGSRSDTCDPSLGCGIAFSYDLTTSKYKLMHEFKNLPKDGAGPVGTQALDSAGNLYGLTFGGRFSIPSAMLPTARTRVRDQSATAAITMASPSTAVPILAITAAAVRSSKSLLQDKKPCSTTLLAAVTGSIRMS